MIYITKSMSDRLMGFTPLLNYVNPPPRKYDLHALLGHAFVNSLFPKIIIELARHEYH